MKKICLTITIAVFLLFLLNEVQAQNTQTKLNQVEMINQSPIEGLWKYEYSKDTIGYADFSIYGTGVDAISKLVSNAETVVEAKIIWAYDKALDKMIGLSQVKGGDVVKLLGAQWISNNKYVLVDYKDISNPVEAAMRTEGTFKSNDLLEINYYVDNKPVRTVLYTRVK